VPKTSLIRPVLLTQYRCLLLVSFSSGEKPAIKLACTVRYSCMQSYEKPAVKLRGLLLQLDVAVCSRYSSKVLYLSDLVLLTV